MVILWLCNVATPNIARRIGAKEPVGGGWIQGAAEALSANGNICIHLCFPQRRTAEILKGETDGIQFWGFPASAKPPHLYDPALERCFTKIIHQIKPDVVHIWGTEYPHTLAMTKAFRNPNKTVIHIQGLCGICATHYTAFLPERACRAWTLRDLLKLDRIVDQQKKFWLRGINEAEALCNAGYVIGRTSWDRACVRQLAPNAQYRVCHETLRREFYENAGTWSLDSCETHSIFVSQASYPLKGFHMVLEAMPEILRRYPDAKLYTTGRDPFKVPFYRINGYQRWLKKQITKLGLRNQVHFLGSLDAQAMCQIFLKSNVFVSASSIENSPNSVGEAMLLGVPTVASFVGGTMDFIDNGIDGFLFPADAPYIMADRVCQLFGNRDLMEQMSKRATKHALEKHDPEKNHSCLKEIYREVYEG